MSKRVYFFGGSTTDGRADMKNLLGGKGANLAEMAQIGIPVPPGFTITTEVCAEYYENNQQFPEGLKDEVLKSLKKVEELTDMKFSDPTNPQLLGEYSDLDIVIAIHQDGDCLFVGEWWQGMVTFDVSDPTNPKRLHNYTDAGGCTAVYATEEYVFVGAGNQLKIMDYDYQVSVDNGKETPFNFTLLGLLPLFLLKRRRDN